MPYASYMQAICQLEAGYSMLVPRSSLDLPPGMVKLMRCEVKSGAVLTPAPPGYGSTLSSRELRRVGEGHGPGINDAQRETL